MMTLILGTFKIPYLLTTKQIKAGHGAYDDENENTNALVSTEKNSYQQGPLTVKLTDKLEEANK